MNFDAVTALPGLVITVCDRAHEELELRILHLLVSRATA